MSMNHRGRGQARIVARALALLLVLTTAARGEGPLTTADVVRFLGAGISENTILYEVRNRGFGEKLDAAREANLRQTGASETLIAALRRAASGEPPKAPQPADQPPAPSTGTGSREPSFPAIARTVRVPVCVLDVKGEPVLGLGSEDFQILEDGKRQKVTLFSGERRPLRIALALDVSGSMDNKIRQVEEALRHFVSLLEPADEIMVITFNDEVRVVQGFTSDRERLGKVLDNIEPFGGTALYDAAFVAIRRVAKEPAESKAVVIVSDGVDTASKNSFDEVREIARRSEVPVFSIGLDAGNPRRNFVEGGSSGHGGRPGGGGHGYGPAVGMAACPAAVVQAGAALEVRAVAGAAGRRPEELRRQAPHRARGRHRRAGRDPEGPRALHAGKRRASGRRDAPSGGRVDRHRRCATDTCWAMNRPKGRSNWRTIRVEVARPEATARARKGYYGGA